MSKASELAKAGYSQSSNDPYKFVNGSSSVTMRPGNGIIIDNGGHNKYGSNTSNSFFRDRIKK